MSDSKYSPDRSQWLDAETVLSDHAIHRWQLRTPQDFRPNPAHLYGRGEHLEHPEVVESDGVDQPLDDAVVYNHGDWGIVYLIVDCQPGAARRVVVTVNNISGFEHKPTRQYLRAYGPHGGDTDA